MCGRFALTAGPEETADFLGVADVETFPARYNIAPTQPILMALAAPPLAPGSNLPERVSLLVRWGLMPAWAKNPGDLPLLFNARSETAAGRASFRAAMRHRRALVPASGFYEWKRTGSKQAQAYWVRPRHGGLIAFAALMETWSEPGGSEIDTGAILTTGANAEFAADSPTHARSDPARGLCPLAGLPAAGATRRGRFVAPCRTGVLRGGSGFGKGQ